MSSRNKSIENIGSNGLGQFSKLNDHLSREDGITRGKLSSGLRRSQTATDFNKNIKKEKRINTVSTLKEIKKNLGTSVPSIPSNNRVDYASTIGPGFYDPRLE
jgi:hypothetical protein